MDKQKDFHDYYKDKWYLREPDFQPEKIGEWIEDRYGKGAMITEPRILTFMEGNNIFRTKEDAIAARDKVRELLSFLCTNMLPLSSRWQAHNR